MMDKPDSLYEQIRREICRIGWRLQYKSKVMRRRETALDDIEPAIRSFAESSDNKIWIEQLMKQLPDHLGKTIVQKVYLQGLTESEVAKQFSISQQAVNKWKQKTLKQLYQIANC